MGIGLGRLGLNWVYGVGVVFGPVLSEHLGAQVASLRAPFHMQAGVLVASEAVITAILALTGTLSVASSPLRVRSTCSTRYCLGCHIIFFFFRA